MQDASDAILVQRTQDGDNQAFGILFERYRDRLASVLRQYARQTADVDDLCQQAFTNAFTAIRTFHGRSAFFTWLYRIAVNTAITHVNSPWQKRGSNFDDLAPMASSEASVDREFESERGTVQVLAAVANLPSSLRDALTLNTLHGFDYEGVANICGCPVGTVRSRISRARTSVRSAMEAHI